MNNIKCLLDILTLFSKDMGMKLIQNPKPLIINDLIIKLLLTGDTHTYFGSEENIAYDGPMSKARMKKKKKNLSRVKKIWSPELPDYNKVVAHSTCAIPIITPAVGNIDWKQGA